MPGMNPAMMQRQVLVNQGVSTPRQFVRPILPGERSVVDKLVDYVVGDGPNNRYALICCFCHMHNGMALKYEFEFLAFRCCYCNTYNPPRKIRSNAPRIMPPPSEPRIEEPESDVEKSVTEEESKEGGEDQRDVIETTQSGDEPTEQLREAENQEETIATEATQEEVASETLTTITEDKDADKKSENVLEDWRRTWQTLLSSDQLWEWCAIYFRLYSLSSVAFSMSCDITLIRATSSISHQNTHSTRKLIVHLQRWTCTFILFSIINSSTVIQMSNE